jgi:hypothetical protein
MWVAFIKARAWLVWVFAIPGLFFVVYWGTADTGLLREGLHAWVLGLLIFSVWILKNFEIQARFFWKLYNWALLSRVFAIPLMLLLPTMPFSHVPVQRAFALSDAVALTAMLVGTVWLSVAMFRHAERLRRSAT